MTEKPPRLIGRSATGRTTHYLDRNDPGRSLCGTVKAGLAPQPPGTEVQCPTCLTIHKALG